MALVKLELEADKGLCYFGFFDLGNCIAWHNTFYWVKAISYFKACSTLHRICSFFQITKHANEIVIVASGFVLQ